MCFMLNATWGYEAFGLGSLVVVHTNSSMATWLVLCMIHVGICGLTLRLCLRCNAMELFLFN